MNKIFWIKEPNQKNEKRGYIERIETSKGIVVEFDHKTDRIDLDVLKPHIGEQLEYYRNGELQSYNKITMIEPNEDGINTLHIERPEKEEVVEKAENEI